MEKMKKYEKNRVITGILHGEGVGERDGGKFRAQVE